MRIFVGNVPFDVTSKELKEFFEVYGSVSDVEIVTDRRSGRSRGIAFLSMGDQAEAEKAIAGLNGEPLKGRSLIVSVARPKTGFGQKLQAARTTGGF